MTTPSSNRLELVLLGLFRWVLLLSMLALIAVTAWFITSAIRQFPAPPSQATPKSAPEQPTIGVDAFLTAVKAAAGGRSPDMPRTTKQRDDDADREFRAHLDRLWTSINTYQVACKAGNSLNHDAFVESMQDTPLQRMISLRGPLYAESQAKFIEQALVNDEVVALCKGGRAGLFVAAIDYHQSEWDRSVRAAEQFALDEVRRITAFREKEELRVAMEMSAVQQKLVWGAAALGLFMLGALILIFARMESHLRSLRAMSVVESGSGRD